MLSLEICEPVSTVDGENYYVNTKLQGLVRSYTTTIRLRDFIQ